MRKSYLPFYYPEFIGRMCVGILLRRRKKKYGYEFRRIKLVGGGYAKVAAGDYEKLSRYEWLIKECKNTSYAWRGDYDCIRFCFPAPALAFPLCFLRSKRGGGGAV